ncbi:MAG: hypothetical protein IJ542_00875 [Clostridia bacterium]|nr:hypothetical protein [Clostridia bacterium]
MDRKNVATTMILILCTLIFASVGASFMTYKYEKNKILVENPKIFATNVSVWSKEDDTKSQIQELKLSSSSLGLKPVTGKADSDTKIPSTVTNKNGSEGLYGSFVVTAAAGLTIKVENIKIESSEDAEKIEKQRENIFVAIMDQTDGAKSLKDDEVILISEPLAVEEKEYTFLFWLDSKAGEELKGSKISFDLIFEI